MTRTEPSVSQLTFDFSEFIESSLQDYIHRPIVESCILSQIDQGRRFIVVLGEPGSGKSALAARLIQSRRFLHHFLRRGHAAFSLARDPYAFYTSIGFQLRARYGDAIFPEAVVLHVEGSITDIAEKGEAVAGQIQRLAPVPWHSAALNINLHTARTRGNTSGMRIREVAEDYRHIPLTAFRQMALIDPLRKLRSLRPDEQVTLWIDGLDEESESLPSEGQMIPVFASLPGPDELGAIPNLSIVISSRRTPMLDRFLADGTAAINLGDAKFVEDNAALVLRYINREVASLPVTEALTAAGKTASDITPLVSDSCADNLLYLRQLFDAIREGQLQALLDDGLPRGLDAMYVRLLDRIVHDAPIDYPASIHPIVCVLASVERSLTGKQLENFTGLGRERVMAGIQRLRAFLHISAANDGDTYSFCDKSFRDSLSREDRAGRSWYVDPAPAHARIAKFYIANGEPHWPALDEYGYSYLIHHLVHAGPEFTSLLPGVLTGQWARAKRRWFRSHRPFQGDLETAATLLAGTEFPRNFIGAARFGLMHSVVAEVAGKIPRGAVTLMVRLGQVQRAFDTVHPDMEVGTAVAWLAEIVAGLEQTGTAGLALRDRALDEGLVLARSAPDHGDLGTLLGAVSTPVSREVLLSAVPIFNAAATSWKTPRALSEFARLHGLLNAAEADLIFQQALESVERFMSSGKNPELSVLFRYWSVTNLDTVLHRLRGLSLRPDDYSIKMILAVAENAASQGRSDVVTALVEFAGNQLLPGIADPFRRARALAMLASTAQEGVGDTALTIEAALDAANSMCSAADSEASLQNRPAQKAAVLVEIAAADADVDPVRARATLERAWVTFRGHPMWDRDAVRTLVKLQYRVNFDLLDTLIEAGADPEIRSELRIGAAFASLDSDPAWAQHQLEQALIEGEVPPPLHEGTQRFSIALADALGWTDRGLAVELLDHSGAPPESIVAWRLRILRSLIAREVAEAEDWLIETFHLWMESVNDIQFIPELPAIIRELPAALLEKFLDVVDEASTAGANSWMLKSAIGAALVRAGNNQGREILEDVLQGMRDAGGAEAQDYPHVVLAFAAGQWWDVESNLAEDLWLEALAQFETDSGFARNASSRSSHLEIMLSALRLGSPGPALAGLLEAVHPPPSPNSLRFVMPGPAVPAHTAAGMEERDYMLALELARQARSKADWRARLARLHNPAVRSLAASAAASSAETVPLKERLQLCELAQLSAAEVGSHHLRSVLLADAAHAFHEAGVKKRGIDLARQTARDILENGEAYGSVQRKPAYQHAFGRCLQLVATDRESADSAALLWEARRLGSAFHTVLAYLVNPVAEYGREALASLQSAERDARGLFG